MFAALLARAVNFAAFEIARAVHLSLLLLLKRIFLGASVYFSFNFLSQRKWKQRGTEIVFLLCSLGFYLEFNVLFKSSVIGFLLPL